MVYFWHPWWGAASFPHSSAAACLQELVPACIAEMIVQDSARLRGSEVLARMTARVTDVMLDSRTPVLGGTEAHWAKFASLTGGI